MTPERRAKLEAAGHKVQSAEDFFDINEAVEPSVECEPAWLNLGREDGRYTGNRQHFTAPGIGGETQASIGAWARQTFPGGDDDSPVHALRLLDEVIELCQVVGCSHRQISAVAVVRWPIRTIAKQLDKSHPEPAKVPAEAADVAITLAVLCERRGIDLKREVNRKMKANRYDREWISNGDGTGRHKRKVGE